MKTKAILFVALIATLLTSCKDDAYYPEPQDFPVTGTFSIGLPVVDKFGNDLLNSGKVTADDVYAVYMGDEYRCDEDANIVINQNVVFHGLSISKYTNKQGLLIFGNFEEKKSREDTYELHWTDGSVDVITFRIWYTWNTEHGWYESVHILDVNGERSVEAFNSSEVEHAPRDLKLVKNYPL